MQKIVHALIAVSLFIIPSISMADPNLDLWNALNEHRYDDAKWIVRLEKTVDRTFAPFDGALTILSLIVDGNCWDILDLLPDQVNDPDLDNNIDPFKSGQFYNAPSAPGIFPSSGSALDVILRRSADSDAQEDKRERSVEPEVGEMVERRTSKRQKQVVNYYEAHDEGINPFQVVRNGNDNNYNPADLRERMRAFMQSEDVEGGYRLLAEALQNHFFNEAYGISLRLYELVIENGMDIDRLLSIFKEIFGRGKNTLGQEYYGWLLYVATWHLEQQPIDVRAEHPKKQIVAGYREAADLGILSARYNLASYFSRIQDHEEACEQWMRYRKESPEPWQAAASLGGLWEMGLGGCVRDLDIAETFYREGHENGHPLSSYNLAGLLESERQSVNGQERQEILDAYRVAGENGYADAWYNLAVIHLHGWNGAQTQPDPNLVNLVEAENGFRQAFELGPLDETNAMAIAETILKDTQRLTDARIQEALHYLDIAIRHGSHEATFTRGVMHMNGQHVPQNIDAALRDFELLEAMNESFDSTHPEGLYFLCKLLFDRVMQDRNAEDRVEQLNRIITILMRADAYCAEFPKGNQKYRVTINNAAERISVLLADAHFQRALLLMARAEKISNPRERKVLLERVRLGCVNARRVFKGNQEVWDLSRRVLAELMGLSLQFALRPHLAEPTPFVRNGGESEQKRVRFSDAPPAVVLIERIGPKKWPQKPDLEHGNPYLEEARKYGDELATIRGCLTLEIKLELALAYYEQALRENSIVRIRLLRTAQHHLREVCASTPNDYKARLRSVDIALANALLDHAREQPLDSRLQILREARDLLQSVEGQNPSPEVRLNMRTIYEAIAETYEKLAKQSKDPKEQQQSAQRAAYYKNEARKLSANR